MSEKNWEEMKERERRRAEAHYASSLREAEAEFTALRAENASLAAQNELLKAEVETIRGICISCHRAGEQQSVEGNLRCSRRTGTTNSLGAYCMLLYMVAPAAILICSIVWVL